LKQLVQKVSETLIEQIDNLSRIASEFSSFATMPQAKKQVMDLHDSLRSIITLYDLGENEVLANIPDEPAWIFADKDQVSRLFNNLVQNAIQAIPEDRVGVVEVTSVLHAGEVTVTVADNGVGITPEQAGKVFVPNFTTKTSGMGLGLPIAKSIAESSGGRIWFESIEGVGTEFFVSLPLWKHTP
jgi:signal transduction histidine kinase